MLRDRITQAFHDPSTCQVPQKPRPASLILLRAFRHNYYFTKTFVVHTSGDTFRSSPQLSFSHIPSRKSRWDQFPDVFLSGKNS